MCTGIINGLLAVYNVLAHKVWKGNLMNNQKALITQQILSSDKKQTIYGDQLDVTTTTIT